ncbi:hypothetical protein ScPMuIL_011391 [Solemya velum]
MKDPEENGTMDDGDVEDDQSSNDSTPTKAVPFKTLYYVTVSDAVKNGDSLQFTVQTTKADTNERLQTCTRQFEDVEWLQHCIITSSDVSGLIIPPLPPRPDIDPRTAESKSKKQLGSGTKVMVGDEFEKDCRNIQKYLRLILAHEVFGKDSTLQKFLVDKEPPIRARVKKGLMSRITSVVDEARKGQHRDIDEYFQKKRDWAAEYSRCVKEASANFNKMVYAQMRLAGCYSYVSTACSSTSVYRDEETVKINQLLLHLGQGLEEAKHGAEVLSANDERTFGFQLELYARHIDSVREMLFRRTCLLVDYEDANKALDKAKPNKRGLMEQNKMSAEKSYETCTDNARRELKTFLQQRMISFEDGLSSFAEAQIKTARDTYALLVKTLTTVKKQNL